MVQNTPLDVARQASTISIVWGVLLVILGMVAIGSPFFAAVAVNVVIAWLIVLAGLAHLMLAFRAHGAGSMIWKLLVGLAYLCFGVYLILHPVLGVASLTLLLAALFLIEGVLYIVLFFQMRPLGGIKLGAGGRDHYVAARADDLYAMAVERGVGNRNAGGRKPDYQRRYASDAVVGSAQNDD